jgi:hypothetical protein
MISFTKFEKLVYVKRLLRTGVGFALLRGCSMALLPRRFPEECADAIVEVSVYKRKNDEEETGRKALH